MAEDGLSHPKNQNAVTYCPGVPVDYRQKLPSLSHTPSHSGHSGERTDAHVCSTFSALGLWIVSAHKHVYMREHAHAHTPTHTHARTPACRSERARVRVPPPVWAWLRPHGE